MEKLYRTAKKLWTTFFTLWHHFGFRVAWYQTIDIITYHFPDTKLDAFIKKNVHRTVKRYLSKHYGEIIEQYKDLHDDTPVQAPKDKIIWQCWWQGEEALNGITRTCVNSVAEHANGHKTVIITEKNVNQYVQIPAFILERVNDKTISLTFFSDYLRMCLLNQNGGFWIDTTVFLSNDLPPHYFDRRVFSPKSKKTDNTYVSDYRWATWAIGGDKGSILFEYVCRMLETYWVNENRVIHYYLFDYIIALGYDNIPAIKEVIDAIPYTNPRKHDLCDLLNTSYDKGRERSDAIFSDTCIHKLSRKTELQEKTAQGEFTIYHMITERYSSKPQRG